MLTPKTLPHTSENPSAGGVSLVYASIRSEKFAVHPCADPLSAGTWNWPVCDVCARVNTSALSLTNALPVMSEPSARTLRVRPLARPSNDCSKRSACATLGTTTNASSESRIRFEHFRLSHGRESA